MVNDMSKICSECGRDYDFSMFQITTGIKISLMNDEYECPYCGCINDN